MKIGWILSGGKGVAGARIQGWNMHTYFSEKGIETEILHAPKEMNTAFDFSTQEINEIVKKEFDVILIQKMQTGKSYYAFIEACHKKGTKVIYIGIDRINIDFATASDGIITVSKYIKNQIPQAHQKKSYQVFDGYEHDGAEKQHTKAKNITLVFTSNNVYTKFPQIEQLPRDVQLKIIGPPQKRVEKYQLGTTLFTKTPYQFEYVIWEQQTVEKEILGCDVAVIPYPQEILQEYYIKRKSSNRLLMFMSYGLPTIVSPHPEYEALIQQGKNGFIAKNPKEWKEYIEFLRDNPQQREKIGNNARKTVINKYSKEQQGKLYLDIIKKILEK